MPSCNHCNVPVLPPAVLCPACGRQANEERSPATTNVAQAEITFGYSASPNYLKAVEICERIPSYTTEGEGKSIRHTVRLPVTEIDLIITVFDLVGSWKTSSMRINGELASKKHLTYGALGCYQGYQKAYNGKRYCFGESEYNINLWGCKRLEMPISAWGGGWLEHGHMDSNGVWHVDKAWITAELMQRLKSLEICPALNFQHILKTLQKIPDRIDPKTDPNWDYITESQRDTSGKWVEIAVGIRPVLKRMGGYIVGGHRPDWGGYTHLEPSRAKLLAQRQATSSRSSTPQSSPAKKRRKSKGFSIGPLKIRSKTEVVIAVVILLLALSSM